MPLNILRLNARHQLPNPRITFLKPLPNLPSTAHAQDFLERIAAIVSPIMKTHHLSLTTLEEYAPNAEFVGRNFNAGEIVQLVLRRRRDGGWLPFRSVQMVMMHELAHCLQMNHKAAFWSVRNLYAGELRLLWARGYTGDGFWSEGRTTVLSGEYDVSGGGVGEEEVPPRALCGGTFRSRRGRKRRKGVAGSVERELTWKEKKERRIVKKFGTGGVALGDDVETRVKLEDGKVVKGKPRVAGSARGRELRAKAALARFGDGGGDVKGEEEEEGESGSESGYDDAGVKEEGALDLDGSRMVDGKGNGMVKVCEGEDQEDVHVKQEMEELWGLDQVAVHTDEPLPSIKKENVDEAPLKTNAIRIHPPTRATPPTLATHPTKPSRSIKNEPIDDFSPSNPSPTPLLQNPKIPPRPSNIAPRQPDITSSPTTTSTITTTTCPICSMHNEINSSLCIACSHVLDIAKVPGHWFCGSPACVGGSYVNAVDCGLCGVCGARRVGEG